MNGYRSFLAAFVALAACCTTSRTQATSANEGADLNAALQRLVAAVNAKDINGIMAYYVPDETLLVFDAIPPRQYVGAAAYRKDWEGVLSL
jgi:ketosteroid isomerase-like protein